MELKVTFMNLMEIENLPDDSVAQDYAISGDSIEISNGEHESIYLPIVMLGATVTLNDYSYTHENEVGDITFSIDKDNPTEMSLFKAIVKKVVKGKIPELKYFDLTNHKLVFNESAKKFNCGCESFSVERAKELVSFLSRCINTTKKPAVKKK